MNREDVLTSQAALNVQQAQYRSQVDFVKRAVTLAKSQIVTTRSAKPACLAVVLAMTGQLVSNAQEPRTRASELSALHVRLQMSLTLHTRRVYRVQLGQDRMLVEQLVYPVKERCFRPWANAKTAQLPTWLT